MRRCLGLK